jgi:hypothetical protein
VRRLIDLPVVALLGGLVVVNLALVASHWTGGGGLHPRYALLLVPVGASLVATAVSRWGGRPGSLLLLVGPLALLWYQVPKSSTWVNDHKTAPLDSPLTTSIGPEWVRLGGLVLVAAGALLVAAALMAVRADAAWRTRGAERYSG